MIPDIFLDSEDEFLPTKQRKVRKNRKIKTCKAQHILKFKLGWQFTNLDVLSMRKAIAQSIRFMQTHYNI